MLGLGPIPHSGTMTVRLHAPNLPPNTAFHYQAVTVALTQPQPTVDTSHPASITIGSPPPPPPCVPGAVVLAITPTNPTPGQPLSVSVTGTAGAVVQLFSSTQQGTTPLPNGAVICLAPPFGSMFLGHIPPSGTLTAQVPTHPWNPPPQLHYQAMTTAPGTPHPTVDTSNVVTVTFQPPPPCPHGAVVLDIQPNGPVPPGGQITKNVTTTPGALVLLASSLHLGQTPLPIPNLSLCLSGQFSVEFMGIVPASGTLTVTQPAPPQVPHGVTIYLQAVAVTVSGGNLVLDTSNLDTIQF
jgi:hypothetical protein